MKIEYLPSFIKDLKKLKKIPIYPEIKTLVFEIIPVCQSLTEIPNLTKLKDTKTLIGLGLVIIVSVFLFKIKQ